MAWYGDLPKRIADYGRSGYSFAKNLWVRKCLNALLPMLRLTETVNQQYRGVDSLPCSALPLFQFVQNGHNFDEVHLTDSHTTAQRNVDRQMPYRNGRAMKRRV